MSGAAAPAAPVVEPVAPVEPATKGSWWQTITPKSDTEVNLGPDGKPLPSGWLSGLSGWVGGKRRRKSNGKSKCKAMKGGSFSPYTAHSSASSASQYGGRRTRRHRTRRHKARKARKSRKHRR
jgi:hypothetical protein